jgi:hypothetical protein
MVAVDTISCGKGADGDSVCGTSGTDRSGVVLDCGGDFISNLVRPGVALWLCRSVGIGFKLVLNELAVP